MSKRASMKVGDRFKTTKSGEIEVIEYKSCKEVWVRFVDTGNEKKVRADNIKLGNVFDEEDSDLADLSEGTIHKTTKNGDVQVLDYQSYSQIFVVFLQTGKTKWTKGAYIRSGYLAPPKD